LKAEAGLSLRQALLALTRDLNVATVNIWMLWRNL
jgi:hypothetical protein